MAMFLEDVSDLIAVKFPNHFPVWFFDHSSCHAAMGDAPCATRMNLGIGGTRGGEELKAMKATTLLEDTPKMSAGTVQQLVFLPGCPPPLSSPNLPEAEYIGKIKGVKEILMERGLWKNGMTKDGKEGRPETSWLSVLQNQKDFLLAKSMLVEAVEKYGGQAILIPKYHCETSPIENVWGLVKGQIRKLCDFRFETLTKNMEAAFVTLPSEPGQDRKGLGCPISRLQLYWRRAFTYHEVYRKSADVKADKVEEGREEIKKLLLSHHKFTGVLDQRVWHLVVRVQRLEDGGIRLVRTLRLRPPPPNARKVSSMPTLQRRMRGPRLTVAQARVAAQATQATQATQAPA